jgi:protein TonB
MESKKTLPWIASLGVHAVLVFVPVGLSVSPSRPPVEELRVTVSLAAGPGIAAERAGSGFALGNGAAVALPKPGGRSARLAALPSPPVSIRPLPSVSPLDDRPAMLPSDALPLPSAQEILADLQDSAPRLDTDTPDAAPGAQVRGGAQIAWPGSPRKIIRWRDPEFPSVLSATGQGAECEARITVAPSGTVIRVEMTKSSGYTEIDASVEAALRDNVFSRVSGTTNAVATVKYRFRPEKQD